MKIRLLGGLIVILFLVGGCSSSLSETDIAPVQGDTISINHFLFEPQELIVNIGTTVTWNQNDSVAHTIVSTDFESETLTRGDQFRFVFNEKGRYDYYCGIHPSMKGKIIVK